MAEIRVRRGGSTYWASVNPILRPGEPGWDPESRTLKIGDGDAPWSTLPAVTTAPILLLSGSTPVPDGTPPGTLIIRTA